MSLFVIDEPYVKVRCSVHVRRRDVPILRQWIDSNRANFEQAIELLLSRAADKLRAEQGRLEQSQ